MKAINYRGFELTKNDFGYYEAHRDDLENYLYAKTINQLKIEVDEYLDEN